MTKYRDCEVLYAIAEAERLAASFERPFSKLHKKYGFTPHLVDLFAKEFMVARTFSWHLGDEKGKGNSKEAAAFKAQCRAERQESFAEFWNSLSCPNDSKLLDQFEELVNQVCEHQVAGQMWRAKNFASALSKFYMVKCDWVFPPFDSHAAKRLGTKIGQAEDFYKVLDENDWSNLADEVDDILQNHGLNLVVAARILDKYLIQNGSGYKDIAKAYVCTQSMQTQNQWQSAASEIAQLLAKSQLGQRLKQ